METKFKR